MIWTAILYLIPLYTSCLATRTTIITVLKIDITPLIWANYNPEEGVLLHRNM